MPSAPTSEDERGPAPDPPPPERVAFRRGAAFGEGFRAMLPIWAGVVPFGLAYAVSARAAGLSWIDTQLMSLLVFAGSAQFTAVGMFAVGASSLALIVTTLVINLRHLLYSLTLGNRIDVRGPTRWLAAQLLTDEAFGVVVSAGRRDVPFLLGAEISLYVSWNLSTAAGAWLGGSVADPAALGLDVIFPLTFLALLVPLVRGRVELLVAIVAGAAAPVLARALPFGVVIVVVGVGGALLGAWLTRDEPEATPPFEDATA